MEGTTAIENFSIQWLPKIKINPTVKAVIMAVTGGITPNTCLQVSAMALLCVVQPIKKADRHSAAL